MNDTGMNYFKEAFEIFKTEHQRYLDSKFSSIEGMCRMHDCRIRSLEKERLKNKVLSGMTGFVGGIAAVIGKMLWKG